MWKFTDKHVEIWNYVRSESNFNIEMMFYEWKCNCVHIQVSYLQIQDLKDQNFILGTSPTAKKKSVVIYGDWKPVEYNL